jgi:CP family cyanate transporter-like MFS transporter
MSSGYYTGALVSPLAFGALADATGGYDASWALTVTAMTCCALCFLVVHRWVRPPVRVARVAAATAGRRA